MEELMNTYRLSTQVSILAFLGMVLLIPIWSRSNVYAEKSSSYLERVRPQCFPYGIVSGPDGNIWFTEHAGDQIGRIDPKTGKILEFALDEGSAPTGITVGVDGWIWFTEYDGNKIDR